MEDQNKTQGYEGGSPIFDEMSDSDQEKVVTFSDMTEAVGASLTPAESSNFSDIDAGEVVKYADPAKAKENCTHEHTTLKHHSVPSEGGGTRFETTRVCATCGASVDL